MAATLDTLKALRRLRQVNVPEDQAEAFAELLRETQEGGLAQLATKAELQAEAAEIRREVAELRADLREEMAELRAELRAEVAELRGELRAGLAELRGEDGATRAELRGEIARSKAGLLMWLLPLLFAQIGALLYLILKPTLGLP